METISNSEIGALKSTGQILDVLKNNLEPQTSTLQDVSGTTCVTDNGKAATASRSQAKENVRNRTVTEKASCDTKKANFDKNCRGAKQMALKKRETLVKNVVNKWGKRAHLDDDGFIGESKTLVEARALGCRLKGDRQNSSMTESDGEKTTREGGFKYTERGEKTVPEFSRKQQSTGRNSPASGGKRSGEKPRVNRKNGRPDVRGMDYESEKFAMTEWYTKARTAGFQTAQALVNFNALVRKKASQLDPRALEFCGLHAEDEHCEFVLCECHLVAPVNGDENVILEKPAAPIFSDGVLEGEFKVKSTVFGHMSKFWNGLFLEADFKSERLLNHNIPRAYLDTPDAAINKQMLLYIRKKMMTDYTVNGVWNRAVVLAHAKRLGLTFLEEKKLEIATPQDLASFHKTVQVAADQEDDQWLLAQRNESRRGWDFRHWGAQVVGAVCFLAILFVLVYSCALLPFIVLTLANLWLRLVSCLAMIGIEIILQAMFLVLKSVILLLGSIVAFAYPKMLSTSTVFATQTRLEESVRGGFVEVTRPLAWLLNFLVLSPLLFYCRNWIWHWVRSTTLCRKIVAWLERYWEYFLELCPQVLMGVQLSWNAMSF